MRTRQARFREELKSREAGAACTACVWLALYGVAVASALLAGPWHHHYGKSVVAAAHLGAEDAK